MFIKPLYTNNNIKYLTKKNDVTSEIYLHVREKENRLLEDNEVIKLPKLNFNEWPIRLKSSNRFSSYLKTKASSLNILDLGCGNGWFTNQIAIISEKNYVIGLDINTYELEQATRVFKNQNLEFAYGDIFQLQNEFKNTFDIITLNGVIQYFSDFNLLIETLKLYLKKNGEIHIIDSPFYAENEIEAAKKRTELYYYNLGFPEMSNFYFHHSNKYLKDFSILYKPKNVYLRKFFVKDSPFCWLFFLKK